MTMGKQLSSSVCTVDAGERPAGPWGVARAMAGHPHVQVPLREAPSQWGWPCHTKTYNSKVV
jgi:hypothetical protein